MKLSDFIVLTHPEKRVIVLEEGVPVAKREIPNHLVFLFQLPGYYVEVFCCLESKAIKEFRVFHSSVHLEPYLDGISIDNLLD
ncbi:MAG: hypothetical protein ABUT20_63305 [Bacteroidota bacterium]